MKMLQMKTHSCKVIYDLPARENNRSLSLNDYLDVVPSLSNLLRRILIRTRFKPTALYGDLQKEFLQILINEVDRDALGQKIRFQANKIYLIYKTCVCFIEISYYTEQ